MTDPKYRQRTGQTGAIVKGTAGNVPTFQSDGTLEGETPASGGAAYFAWSLTDAWIQTVGGGSQPSGALTLFGGYDAPAAPLRSTVVPPEFDWHPASGSISNISGGPLVVECRAVIVVETGDFPEALFAFCNGLVVPDMTDPGEVAVAGAVEQAGTGATGNFITMAAQQFFALANGDDMGVAFGWGTSSGPGLPVVRSFSASFQVVG